MALLTCGGADVLDGAIHISERGTWWAPLRLDTALAPTGKVTLAAEGGFSLSGFVTVGGVFCDVASVQMVGGAGGLGTILTPAAYQNAQLRDPLSAIMNMSGESQSVTIEESLLAVQLPYWTVVASTAARAIDELCGAATAALGNAITWRILSDGTVWIGSESWPTQQIQKGSDVLEAYPDQGRYVLGCDTPWLLPGVSLSGIGNVSSADHFFDSHEVRTWAWV